MHDSKQHPLNFANFELGKVISLLNQTFNCMIIAIKIIKNELCTTIKELCNHINNYAINLRTMQLYAGVVQ